MTLRAVAALIVAYQAPDQLATALDGLGGAARVVVVDNSSSSACRRVATAACAEYVDAGSNLGFASGVNLGLRQIFASQHPVNVLLLNPDAVLQPKQLELLQAALYEPGAERVAAVAPAQLHPDSSAPQRVAWPWPSPMGAWIEAVGLGRLRRSPDFLTGSILLLRWEALLDVGLFDERFFLYAEETDWQRRAARRGWQSRYRPDVVGLHLGAGTSTDSAQREALFYAAAETYVRKWYGAGGWQVYRIAVLVGAAARGTVLRDARRAAARRRLSIFAAGPRRIAAGMRP